MRFTCEKHILSAAVATASRAAAMKSPIPALDGLLVEALHNVKITGYDLKKGIYTTMEADVSSPGSIVIGARLFADIVRKLPDDIVTIETQENGMVNIVCGKADFSIMGSSAENYPELPVMDYSSSLTVSQETLRKMIAETCFALSTNESRPIYTGALFEVERDVLTVVAVDGYRLALRRESAEKCDVEACHFVVPGNALSDLEKICAVADSSVRITVGSKHITFSVGDTVLLSRRLEGEFLNYRKTVPSDFAVRVKADRADLIRCADRVSLVIDDRLKNPLRCSFGDGEVNIQCATPLGRAEDTCPAEGDGGGMVIGFNNQYLLDALKAAPSERLFLCFNGGTSPCVLLPENGSEDFLYMILPVRLRAGD